MEDGPEGALFVMEGDQEDATGHGAALSAFATGFLCYDAAMQGREPHILTVDVEDWHDTETMLRCLPGGAPRPPRIEPTTRLLLDLFDQYSVRATFFVLGRVAREHPRLVRDIAAAGHEVATHGDSHRMLDVLGPERFRQELRDSIGLLEDLAGARILGHRAATWSVRAGTLWALPILEEEGLLYDASLFPCPGLGVAGAPSRPYRFAGMRLAEIPPLVHWGIPAGGGVWLRLLPALHTRLGLRERPAGVVYVHPWEVDPEPPRPPVPWLARLLQSVGTSRTGPRLRGLLEEFHFRPAAAVLETLEPLPSRELAGLARAGTAVRPA